MEMKFTKGEWEVGTAYQTESGITFIDIKTDKKQTVAEAKGWQYKLTSEETKANAKIIAAAPNLLEALTKMLKWKYCYDLRPEEVEAFEATIKQSEAAIKKATT